MRWNLPIRGTSPSVQPHACLPLGAPENELQGRTHRFPLPRRGGFPAGLLKPARGFREWCPVKVEEKSAFLKSLLKITLRRAPHPPAPSSEGLSGVLLVTWGREKGWRGCRGSVTLAGPGVPSCSWSSLGAWEGPQCLWAMGVVVAGSPSSKGRKQRSQGPSGEGSLSYQLEPEGPESRIPRASHLSPEALGPCSPR